MTYQLSDRERDGVLSARDQKQYDYFINKVADWQEVFVITNGDHRGRVTADGTRMLAAWPHPKFIEGQLIDGWEGFKTEAIEVHEFLGVLEELDADGMDVALMRQGDGSYLQLTAKEVAKDIRDELEKVE